jgi:hypothetical protein
VFSGDSDFQTRLDTLKDQDKNIDAAKAHCLIDELILRAEEKARHGDEEEEP